MRDEPIALVTGAGRRIGRAIAEDLGRNGYRVAVHANRSMDGAAEAVARIRASGGAAEAFGFDLARSEGPGALFEAVTARFGPPRLLVNSASVFEADSAENFDPALFDLHMTLHVKVPVLLTAAMAAALPEGADGLVVNVIDERVWRLNPGFFSYTLSKSALWTATRTLAMAHAPRLRVNAIGPGPTLPSPRQSQADFDRQAAAVPLGRGPALSEFGAAIRFLDAARSVTGQMIALDGGQHLAWQTPDTANMVE